MHRAVLALCFLLTVLSLSLLPPREPARAGAAGRPAALRADWANTFSIVAYDPKTREWGVAVASKYLAVGAAVPFGKAGVGAIATQSAVNVTYGPKGLELLGQGKSAEQVVKTLTDADEGKEYRQLG